MKFLRVWWCLALGACAAPAVAFAQESKPVIVVHGSGEDKVLYVDGSGGISVTFPVPAPGTIQWFRDGVAVGSAVVYNGQHSILPAASGIRTVADSGNYTVEIISAGVTFVSDPVPVKIVGRVNITTQPSEQTEVLVGETVTLSVLAESISPIRYQWYEGGVFAANAISGATGPTLTLTNVQPPAKGSTRYFQVTATTGGEDVKISKAAYVDVLTLPEITGQLAITSIRAPEPGSTVVLRLEYKGEKVTVEWLKDGEPAPGAKGNDPYSDPKSTSLMLSNLDATHTGTYTVRLTTGAGSVVSEPVLLELYRPIEVTTVSGSQNVPAGSDATLRIAATGSDLTYQWYGPKENLIPGATSDTLVIQDVRQNNGTTGLYRCILQDRWGRRAASDYFLVLTASPPLITEQPVSLSGGYGSMLLFKVSVAGTAPITYEWRHNGKVVPAELPGRLVITLTSSADAGEVRVTVSNPYGSTTSNAAKITYTTEEFAPVITAQPASLEVKEGEPASFSVSASGFPAVQYQWRKNGGLIPHATSSFYEIDSVKASDLGSYSVVVSNLKGSVTSAAATLSFKAAPEAPVITAQPQSVSAREGEAVEFSVGVSGTAPISYQWLKGGAAISGATASRFVISSVALGDAADYTVVVSNALGSVVSVPAKLTVTAQSGGKAATYFGKVGLGESSGDFALHLRGDGTAALLVFVPASQIIVVAPNIEIGSDGAFTTEASSLVAASATARVGSSADGIGPLAISAGVMVSGRVDAATGTVVGALGGSGLTFQGARLAGPSNPAVEGFYFTPAINGGVGELYLVVAADGRALLVGRSGAGTDGGLGILSSGTSTIAMRSGAVVTLELNSSSGHLGVLADRGVLGNLEFQGVRDGVGRMDRLVNISTRGFAGRDDETLIAGFNLRGDAPRPVLIRAVGPALVDYGVSQAIADSRLVLYQGTEQIASSDNWGDEADPQLIATTAARVGAFPLSPGSKDAAMVTTLSPGSYTVHVGGAGQLGVALMEVYDAGDRSDPSTAPRLINISTRGRAGTGDETLIAGFAVTGNAPRQVLLRAIGPSLSAYGVTSVLTDPQLTLYRGEAAISANDDWGGDVEIAKAASRVGAFSIAASSRDACILRTLQPGNYTVHVNGKNGARGVVLVEVYEVP